MQMEIFEKQVEPAYFFYTFHDYRVWYILSLLESYIAI